MSIKNALLPGLAGNEFSKKITGTSEVSAARTAVAVGAGAISGALASGAVVVGTATLGVVSAPVTIPLALGSAVIAGIASLFD